MIRGVLRIFQWRGIKKIGTYISIHSFLGDRRFLIIMKRNKLRIIYKENINAYDQVEYNYQSIIIVLYTIPIKLLHKSSENNIKNIPLRPMERIRKVLNQLKEE